MATFISMLSGKEFEKSGEKGKTSTVKGEI